MTYNSKVHAHQNTLHFLSHQTSGSLGASVCLSGCCTTRSLTIPVNVVCVIRYKMSTCPYGSSDETCTHLKINSGCIFHKNTHLSSAISLPLLSIITSTSDSRPCRLIGPCTYVECELGFLSSRASDQCTTGLIPVSTNK